jgi:hypothetical protein
MILKPCIHCTRLLREAVFFALPRKVDTMLARAARSNEYWLGRQPRNRYTTLE